MTKHILTIGMQPELVDFSKAPVPGLTAEKVYAGLAEEERRFRELGFEPTRCLIDKGETAEAVAKAALQARSYDVVMIGAGVRAHPDQFLLFEKIINVVHEHAPGSKIAFNTAPTTTVDAVLRWAAAPVS
jgi:hypothetical protein